MPESTGETINTKIIEGNPPAPILRSVIQPRSSLEKPPTYQQIQQRINAQIEATHQKNPNVPQDRIRSTFFTYFGPLLLDQQVHLEGAKRPEDKLLSARIQHALVRNAAYAIQPQASERFTQHMYQQLRTLQTLCEQSNLGENNNLLTFWNGVKAELGIVNALTENNQYTVLLPDYKQDPETTSVFDNEVLQWDVKSGIDLIAIPNADPTRAILIDAKGRKQEDGIHGREERNSVSVIHTEQDITRVNSCVKKTLDEFGIQQVERAKVVIPTAGGYLGTVGNLPQTPPDGNYRAALEQFSSLKPEIATGLRNQLENVTTNALAA